jgi:toxin secretion/phage lysis holin
VNLSVEGVLAGQDVELTDFQLFISVNIFCFKKKKNGARRFRKVYIQLARKNAKSQYLAIVGAYIAFLGDEKQRIYIAGWQKDQSDEVYTAIRDGIVSSSLLDGKWKEAYGKMEIFRNGSVIVPLSKETRKTGDDKKPSVGIVDEYHNQLTSEIYDVLQSGMVARKEPLMFVITTAGFDLSRPCFTEYEYVCRILDPDDDIENDDYFAIICELDEGDDIKDESNWIKANPLVATYEEGLESIQSDLKTALDVPEKMRAFMTKTMNIWVDMKVGGYIPASKWKACKLNEFEITGRDVYIGIDLSKRIDLTSAGFDFPTENGHHVMQHSFMPEEALAERRTLISYLVDGFGLAFAILLGMMVIDYVTGILAAIVNKNLNSSISRNSFIRKMYILLLVWAIYLLGQAVEGLGYIGDGVTVAYIVIEFISITENGGKLGVPMPGAVKKVITVLKDGGNNDNSKTNDR